MVSDDYRRTVLQDEHNKRNIVYKYRTKEDAEAKKKK